MAQLCRAVSSQLRHGQSEKLVKQQYLLHMFAHYGELRFRLVAEIGSGVWGTPANFNGFRVLPSLLQRRRSPEANQTLHDVWPSACAVTLHIAGRPSRWASAHISSYGRSTE